MAGYLIRKLAVVWLSVGTAVAASPVEDMAAFRQAVVAGDDAAIRKLYDPAHAAWLATNGSERDVRLDYFVAEHAVRTGMYDTAVAFANAALLKAGPAERGWLLLVRGDANDLRSDPAAALADYRAALASNAVGVAADARIGIAWLTLDAAQVAEIVGPLLGKDASIDDRWEASLTLSRALQRSGNATAAAVHRAAAWRDAPLVTPAKMAVQHSSGDLAAEFLRDGRRDQALALLAAGRGSIRVSPDALPPCGWRGIQPDDRITAAAGTEGLRPGMVLSATRPEIVAPFVERLAHVPLSLPGTRAVVSLACTKGPTRMRPPPVSLSSTSEWWAAKLQYSPPVGLGAGGSGDERISALRTDIAKIEKADGPASARLIPYYTTLTWTYAAMAQTDPSYFERVAETQRKVIDMARVNGAPAGMIDSLTMMLRAIEAQYPAARVSTDAPSPPTQIMDRVRREPDPLWAAANFASSRASYGGDPELLLRDIMPLGAFLQQSDLPPGDERLKTYALAAVPLLRKLDRKTEAERLIRQARIDPGFCAVIEQAPVIRDEAQLIGSDDYPAEALRWGIEGITGIEWRAGADGVPADVRVIISYPPTVFHSVTTQRLANIRFDPPKLQGRVASCEASNRQVVWRIPGVGQTETAPPPSAPDS